MKLFATITLFFLLTLQAQADLNIRFDEGAPKDRFTITNFGACDIGPTSISIDLSGSTFGLVFDVTAKGAGVEVFQPFEVTIGRENLSKIPMVKDGDNIIKLDLTGLKSKESFAFTIDVDDTKKSREITVSNSELQGAKVVAKDQKQTISAPFQENASATLELSSCGA